MTDRGRPGGSGESAGHSESRYQQFIEVLLTIDRSRFDAAFSLLLLAFMGSLLIQTVDYGSQTRLVPLVIGVPTLVLLGLLLATQLSRRLATVIGQYGAGGLFDGVSDRLDEFEDGDDRPDEDATATPDSTARSELGAVLLWVMVLFLLVGVIGFIAGSFVYLVAFYRFRAKQGWLRTAAYAVVVWLFAVVVFKAVLNTPLYEGLLGVEVPLPI